LAVGSLALLTLAALIPAPAAAVEVESLYTVDVDLTQAEGDPQAWAYGEALQTVLLRVTGSEAAMRDESLLELFPDPARYVLRFRSGADNTLAVTVDGTAIEAVLRAANRPVWGSDRPLTLVWLAVDWGDGEREIVAADDLPDSADSGQAQPRFSVDVDREVALRQRVLDAATRRGIPVLFPLQDSEDRASVRFSDVWGGFDAALLEASRRYGTASILVGRVRADDLAGARWNYYFGNQQLNWLGEPETVLAQLADALAEQFSSSGSGSAEQLTLTVSGVDSVQAFGAVRQVLSELSMVDGYRIDTVEGGDIRYRLSVQGNAERLASALEFSGVLEALDRSSSGTYSTIRSTNRNLDYRYRPRNLPREGRSTDPLLDADDESEPPVELELSDESTGWR